MERNENPRYHEIIQSVKDLGSMAVVWGLDKLFPREAFILRDLDTPQEIDPTVPDIDELREL